MIHRKPEPFEQRPLRSALRTKSLAAERAEERRQRRSAVVVGQYERDAAQLLHEALFGFGNSDAGTPTLQ